MQSDITWKGDKKCMANIMTVRATDKLQELLQQKAKQKGLTRNALVLQILWDWIKQEQRKEKNL